MHYEWLALAAAALWAISGLISATPASHLGTFAYSRWRMACVSVMLVSATLLTTGWSSLSAAFTLPIILSGLIGIFIGDTALFACMNRLGPRRAMLMYSCHSLFSALLGVWLFQEVLTGTKLLGAMLVFSGVTIAVFFRQGAQQQHQWEHVKGSVSLAVIFGLTAALCQALGGVLAKPALADNIDPLAGSAVRMLTALAAHCVMVMLQLPLSRPVNPITPKVFAFVVVNGFLAMGLGMTFIMYALKWGEVGMVAILSSTTPVIVLPFIWLFTKIRPSPASWAGAFLAVIGTALIIQH